MKMIIFIASLLMFSSIWSEELVGRGLIAQKCRMFDSALNPEDSDLADSTKELMSFGATQAAYAFMTAFNLHLDAQYQRDLGADSTDVLKAYVKDQCGRDPGKWVYEVIISYFERLPKIRN